MLSRRREPCAARGPAAVCFCPLCKRERGGVRDCGVGPVVPVVGGAGGVSSAPVDLCPSSRVNRPLAGNHCTPPQFHGCTRNAHSVLEGSPKIKSWKEHFPPQCMEPGGPCTPAVLVAAHMLDLARVLQTKTRSAWGQGFRAWERGFRAWGWGIFHGPGNRRGDSRRCWAMFAWQWGAPPLRSAHLLGATAPASGCTFASRSCSKRGHFYCTWQSWSDNIGLNLLPARILNCLEGPPAVIGAYRGAWPIHMPPPSS